MNKPLSPQRMRGAVRVRADASNPVTILNEMRKTWEDFKAENNEELAALKKGMADVVKTEKVDRINAEITALQKTLDEVNTSIAALSVGGLGGGQTDPAKAEHAKVFNTWFRRGDRAVDADLHELEVKAAMSTDSDPDGGYLVPEEMADEVDRVVGTISVMRDLAQNMTISTDTYKKLVNLAGTGSGWVGEREARPETATPQLVELVFNMQELYANPAITQRALDDSRLDIAAWLADEVSTEFAEQEGAAFISGDGVNKPRGILSYPTVANTSYAWGKVGFKTSGLAGGFAATNPGHAVIDTYFALKQQYRNDAEWIMSDATMNTVRKFQDGDGNYIWQLPSGSAELPTILMKPVRTDDNMDKVEANKFPIAFGNFNRAYLIVDRFGIRVLRDPYTNKPHVHFYTTKRVGGGVKNFEAYKLLKIAA